MSLFRRKRRHGRRSPGPRAVTTRVSTRKVSRQWQRRFRKLLGLSDGNRRVAASEDGQRLTGGRALAAVALRGLGRGLVYLAVVAAVASVPLALRAGWHALLDAPHFLLREVVVEGNARVSGEAVVAAAGLDVPVNTLSLDEDAIAEAVRQLPWIRTADVEVLLPREARLRVTERHPSAVLALGGQYLVDERGALFAATNPEEVLGLPLLTGFLREDFTDPTLQAETRRRVRGALGVLRAWRAADVETWAPLSALESHRVYGYIARLRDGGAELWLGFDDFREKLARAADVIADLHQRGLRARFVYLDTDDTLQRVVVEAESGGGDGRLADAGESH